MGKTWHYGSGKLWPELERSDSMHARLSTEEHLIAAALQLRPESVSGWSPEESQLAKHAEGAPFSETAIVLRKVKDGLDPLGETFCALRPAKVRRDQGATYTPMKIVEKMVAWAAKTGLKPRRIVDPGCGSGRFLLAAGKAFPQAELIGIEIDPLAAIIARANLAATGLAKRATVQLQDYRDVSLPAIDARTLFIGNPPYVRHHKLKAEAKAWLSCKAGELGFASSQLAGLHVYFFLATVLKARKDDFGIFITSAEWLDVNYGRLVRELFLNGLGGQGMTIVEPATRTFADADTTSVITQFVIASKPATIRVRMSKSLAVEDALTDGKWLNRENLAIEKRWSNLTRRARKIPEGYVELGEFCRVHRGQVTGANHVWIAGPHTVTLPESVLFPTVTRAKELFAAGTTLDDVSRLRDVIDLPEDLSIFSWEERAQIDRFLDHAKSLGANRAYVAQNRRAWWSVGLKPPAPILATYMARRKPAFVRNLAGARHINIAHGIYPREPLPPAMLDALAQFLSSEVSLHGGRTYAGGLTKFEPREMERIPVPSPEFMEAMRTA